MQNSGNNYIPYKDAIDKPTTLSSCQVSTPISVVYFVWRLILERRNNIKSVVDFGAGDCRFAIQGNFQDYVGVEIDITKTKHLYYNRNIRINNCDAFDFEESGFDLAIGNPPYIRHHEIDKRWLENVQIKLSKSLGVERNFMANLFMYFILLSLEKTHERGLTVLVVPCEWTVRPSYKPLRNLLDRRGWKTEVYFLEDEVFEGVMTTACITIIDKSIIDRNISYYSVDCNFIVKKRLGVTGSGLGILSYENRGRIWAMRGLSPGNQKAFTLTEGERIHHGLSYNDVVPCITTLKNFPNNLFDLTSDLFNKYFIQKNERCWLVRSDDQISNRVINYYDNVPIQLRSTATCLKRSCWFAFTMPKVSDILFSTGFTSKRPKFVKNTIGAIAIGGVAGIYGNDNTKIEQVINYLIQVNFSNQIVAHSNGLKKVEIGQMNYILSLFI